MIKTMHGTGRGRRTLVGALAGLVALSGMPLPALAQAASYISPQASGAWRRDGARWAYVLDDGSLATGWQMIEGGWYLMDGDGTMLTGWQEVGGQWYLLDRSGRMLTGWQLVDGSWYLLAASGAMLTGWQKVGGTWYHLGASGRMHADRWLLEGDAWYYLLGSGAMATGWVWVGSSCYYFYENGKMAEGTIVDGYYVDENGAWVPDAPEQASYATLVVPYPVDPRVQEACVCVSSADVPFAQDLDASLVRLGGAFGSCTLLGVSRGTAGEVKLMLSGAFEDGGVGIVSFGAGSFAQKGVTGDAYVDVKRQDACLPDVSYARQGDEFVLMVDAGSAQLPDGFEASQVSLPANEAIRVTDVTAQAYDNALALRVQAPGATPYEQFQTLDAALTEGGVRLEGTTAGAVVAAAQPAGGATALSYVSPHVTAFIERGAGGKGYQLLDDGGANVMLVVRAVSTGGDPDLSHSTFAFDDAGLTYGGMQVLADARYQAELLMDSYSADELAELRRSLGYESTEALMDALVYTTASRMAEGLTIYGGVTNAWGIELPDSVGVRARTFNLTGLDAESDVQAQGLDVQASDSVVNESFTYTAEILKAIGSVVTSAATGNPGGAIAGAGSLLTFIATATAPTKWSINDVMNRVIALGGRMDELSAQVGEIGHRLDALKSAVVYSSKVERLTSLAQQGLRYRPWVMGAFDALGSASDRDTYQLSQGTDTPTGKALQTLYNQTVEQTKLTGGAGNTTAKVALDLGNAILGNGVMQDTGGVQCFFDYTASGVSWEPEAYHARRAFVSYMGSAFYCAYVSAMNELNHDIYAAPSDEVRSVRQATAKELMEVAGRVGALIGAGGSAQARLNDRGDGKVLCTINGRLYAKRTRSGAPAIYFPLAGTDAGDFKSAFGDLLSSRNEDKDHTYSSQSTMAKEDFDTMIARQGYVRTVPGFEQVWNIAEELYAVGVLDSTIRPTIKGTPSTDSPQYTSVSFDDRFRQRALVGKTELTDKTDQASITHSRTYSAPVYDVMKNQYLGKQTFYKYDLDYKPLKLRWYLWLWVNLYFEMHAS